MPAPARIVLRVILEPAGIDEDGNPVAPEVAAARVVELLGETRTVDAGAGKREPLGAVVDVNVELEGLRGQPVLLSWSIWQQGGETRLFENWLGTTAVYQLEDTSDHDTASFDLWVPTPREPGSYYSGLRSLRTVSASLVGAASRSTKACLPHSRTVSVTVLEPLPISASGPRRWQRV